MPKITQGQRIIEALRKRPLTTADFYHHECPQCGYGEGLNIAKYSSRIADLRKLGYIIKAEKIKPSFWKYTLVRDPFGGASETTPPKQEKSYDERPKFGMQYCDYHKRNYHMYGNCVDCITGKKPTNQDER
jgi:hypothetical protein